MMHLVTQTPPVQAGDVVLVEAALTMPSGRILRRGRYTVLRLEGRRLVVAYRPDCKALGSGFKPKQGEPVPLCAEPALAYLDAGQYTAHAGDRADRDAA